MTANLCAISTGQKTRADAGHFSTAAESDTCNGYSCPPFFAPAPGRAVNRAEPAACRRSGCRRLSSCRPAERHGAALYFPPFPTRTAARRPGKRRRPAVSVRRFRRKRHACGKQTRSERKLPAPCETTERSTLHGPSTPSATKPRPPGYGSPRTGTPGTRKTLRLKTERTLPRTDNLPRQTSRNMFFRPNGIRPKKRPYSTRYGTNAFPASSRFPQKNPRHAELSVFMRRIPHRFRPPGRRISPSARQGLFRVPPASRIPEKPDAGRGARAGQHPFPGGQPFPPTTVQKPPPDLRFCPTERKNGRAETRS